MEFKNNIADLADSYQYFIFDIWGIIHDGSSTYDGVIEAIKSLRQKNKKICFLSNAPRRAFKVEKILQNFGITSDLYDFVLTSGETSFLELKQDQNTGFKKFGKKYFYAGPEKDLDLLQGLQHEIVNDLAKADFLLVTGFNNDDSVLEEKLPIIKEAIKYNLLMICPNPDLIVVKKNGSELICAGSLAKEYEKIGGKVQYYGKPYKKVYEKIYDFFCQKEGLKIDKKQIIAIGDGLETDIKGANDFDVDTVLSTSGILCNKLNVNYGQEADKLKLETICKEYDIFPKFVIAKL